MLATRVKSLQRFCARRYDNSWIFRLGFIVTYLGFFWGSVWVFSKIPIQLPEWLQVVLFLVYMVVTSFVATGLMTKPIEDYYGHPTN